MRRQPAHRAAGQTASPRRHRTLRQTRSTKIIADIFEWLDAQKPLHPPKSPLGRAINDTLKQREALSVFLDNPKVSRDNNLSERNLRLIALGRKNFLFVGNDQAGENLAILQSLVATCVANDVNPQDYLADVLMRIQEHPQSAIAELMPYNWQPQD
jgi:transposase